MGSLVGVRGLVVVVAVVVRVNAVAAVIAVVNPCFSWSCCCC